MLSKLLPSHLLTWSHYSLLRILLFLIISISIFTLWWSWWWLMIVCFIVWCVLFWRSYQRWWVVSIVLCLMIIGASIIWVDKASESLSVLLYYSLCSSVLLSLYEWSKLASSINVFLWVMDSRSESISEIPHIYLTNRYIRTISKKWVVSTIIRHCINNSLVYASILLLLWIRWPLLVRWWYLHMLDFTTTPYIPWSDITSLQSLILKISSSIIPTWIGEKILRIGWFVIGWMGIVQCCRSFGIRSKWIQRYALCLLWINPFVYARSIDGQINVVLITMVLPRLLYSIVSWYYSPTYKRIIYIIIVELILWTLSPHGFIIGIGVLITFLVGILIQYHKDPRKQKEWWRFILKRCILIVWWSIGINLFWIVPAIVDPTNAIRSVIDAIDQFHFKAYETHNLMWSITFNPLALVWYRWEIQQRFIVHTGLYTQLSYTIILIWISMIIWLKYVKAKDRWIRWWIIVSLIVAWISAQGVNYISLFSEFNSRCMSVLPPLKGMRDAHKRTAWIVIIVTITSSMWLHSLSRSKKLVWFVYISRLLPFLYTPMMVGGMHRQITSTPYPPSWNNIITTLQDNPNIDPYTCNKSEQCYDIFILPWHSYMHFRYAQRVTATPFNNFLLPYRARVAHNVEFNNEYYSQSPWWLDTIDTFLGYPYGRRWTIQSSLSPNSELSWSEYREIESFVKLLTIKHNVHYLLLLKESDYQNYLPFIQYLKKLWFITQSLENEEYILYSIHTNKIYEYHPRIEWKKPKI